MERHTCCYLSRVLTHTPKGLLEGQPSAYLNEAWTGGGGDFAVERGRQVRGWRVETYQVEGIGGFAA